jgi:hypothetical protein
MLSRVSGQEHKRMCVIILGLIIDLPLPSTLNLSCMIKAVCALLDFIYLAQLTSHTDDTICWLEDSLATFHNNKAIFIDLRVREHFNIPKLHSLSHYESSIQQFGTADNYNMKQSKHLHIDLAKDAYHTTNYKDKYFQMTVWLERQEKIEQHADFVVWRQHTNWCISLSQTQIGPPCLVLPQFSSVQFRGKFL